MEHILLTAFLCFVAFVALGQAAYACPRHESAAKLYAPPGLPTRAVSMRPSHAAELPFLQMVEGGKAGWINPEEEAAPVLRAA